MSVFKYDSFDAGEYASNNLDVEVIKTSCTKENDFKGSKKYELD
jgi:hypothetical protein